MHGGRLVRDVTLLALRLDRLAPGVLDGPGPDPALSRHVADEPVPEPGELARQARRLGRALAGERLPVRRERHLAAQIGALECRARVLAGDGPGYRDEVETCFGVPVRREDPDRYREAHRRLDALLPGGGPLAARLAEHRERDRVPPGRLGEALHAMSDELRRTANARIALPAGEGVEFDVVHGRPWTAFTRHLGRARSRVTVDAGARLRCGRLLPLVAHEAYPGHHVQHCRAERAGARFPELRLRLVHSPQGLLAEGAAEVAHEVLPGPGWGRVAERVLDDIGLTTDGELAEAVETALDDLGRVRQDAALMRHADRIGPDEVVAHLTRWLLVDEDRARRMLAFLDHPQWRTYPTAYAEGRPLVRAWIGTDPPARLLRLLDEPMTPEDLRRDLGHSAEHPDTPHGTAV